jgi:hypothetical protein
MKAADGANNLGYCEGKFRGQKRRDERRSAIFKYKFKFKFTS